MTRPAKPKPVIPTGPGACRLCERWRGKTSVCIPGWGPTQPKLIVIAEAPASMEDTWCRDCQLPTLKGGGGHQGHALGQPLVGPSGQLLRKLLADAGIDPLTVFYTNVVRCGSSPETPTLLEMRKCRSYLIEEASMLDLSQCLGTLLLGLTALRGVLNRGRVNLGEVRSRALEAHMPIAPLAALPVRATYHPASLLYRQARHNTNDPNYAEVVQDILDFTLPRDDRRPVTWVTTRDEIDTVLGDPTRVSLDLEWKTSGVWRIGAMGTPTQTVVTTTPALLIDWIQSRAGDRSPAPE